MQTVNELAGCPIDTLGQHGDAHRAQRPPDLERRLSQRAVGGEQRHQVAVQRLRHVGDYLGSPPGVFGAPARVGEIVGHHEQRVPPVVERAVHQQLFAFFREAHPLPEESEIGVGGQRRAGQYHRLLLLEQLLGQDGAHRQRRGVKGEVAPDHVDPLDLFIVIATKKRRQPLVQQGNILSEAG